MAHVSTHPTAFGQPEEYRTRGADRREQTLRRELVGESERLIAHGRSARRIDHVQARPIALNRPAERKAQGEVRSVQQKWRRAEQPSRQTSFGADKKQQSGSGAGEQKRARAVKMIMSSSTTDR